MSCTRLCFGRYVLDLHRGTLTCEGREIELRPKAFSVLRFLVENDGRLISKEDLFAAVWPEVTVTDDALVQVIGELRRALGEDGQRFIKTVPRRGYRFDLQVARTPEREVATAPIVVSDNVVLASAVVPGEPLASDPSSSRSELYAARPVTFRGVISRLQVLCKAMADQLRVHKQVRLIGFCAVAVLVVAALGSYLLSHTPEPSRSALAPLSTGGKPTIAIVPFTFTGDAAASAYFADGVTQDLIAALGRFSALTVMSWNAVAPFKSRQCQRRSDFPSASRSNNPSVLNA